MVPSVLAHELELLLAFPVCISTEKSGVECLTPNGLSDVDSDNGCNDSLSHITRTALVNQWPAKSMIRKDI